MEKKNFISYILPIGITYFQVAINIPTNIVYYITINLTITCTMYITSKH